MRALSKTVTLSLGLLALAACGRNSSEDVSALSDELRQELESAASSSQLELAAAARDFQPALVVSEIEKGTSPARQPSASPSRKVRAPAPRPQPQVSPEPEPVHEQSQEIAMTETAPEPEAPPTPAEPAPVATRPTPTPVMFPTGGTGSSDAGESDRGGVGIGDVIAVVIRGGGVGVDHCEIHDRRRGRRGAIIGTFPGGGIAINNRFPMIGRTTFPR